MAKFEGLEKVAQDYYDSEDAFNFYTEVWGGENLHVGRYPAEVQAVPLGPERVYASGQSALEYLAAKHEPSEGQRVVDMGAGIGGCARYYASKFGATVVCIDLSKLENQRNVEKNKAAGLEHLVLVPGERSFSETGEADASADLVVSEDSYLHAGEFRADCMKEAARILKPGGHLVFTDPMQTDDCDPAFMGPIYQRINLPDMGSPGKYRAWCEAAGLEFVEFDDQTEHARTHYATVQEVLALRGPSLVESKKVSQGYVDRMSFGLGKWVEGAETGNVCWGYFTFRKPLAG